MFAGSVFFNKLSVTALPRLPVAPVTNILLIFLINCYYNKYPYSLLVSQK
jgi:hypothetical protein